MDTQSSIQVAEEIEIHVRTVFIQNYRGNIVSIVRSYRALNLKSSKYQS